MFKVKIKQKMNLPQFIKLHLKRTQQWKRYLKMVAPIWQMFMILLKKGESHLKIIWISTKQKNQIIKTKLIIKKFKWRRRVNQHKLETKKILTWKLTSYKRMNQHHYLKIHHHKIKNFQLNNLSFPIKSTYLQKVQKNLKNHQ